jgi:hypothetical protein
MSERQPQDAIEVERLAIAMAAANGLLWARLDPVTTASYRRAANGALIHLDASKGAGSGRLVVSINEMAATMRDAAQHMEGEDHADALIKRLCRSATHAETMAAVFGAMGSGAGAEAF